MRYVIFLLNDILIHVLCYGPCPMSQMYFLKLAVAR